MIVVTVAYQCSRMLSFFFLCSEATNFDVVFVDQMVTKLVAGASVFGGVLVIFIAISSVITKCLANLLTENRILATDTRRNQELSCPLVEKQWKLNSNR